MSSSYTFDFTRAVMFNDIKPRLRGLASFTVGCFLSITLLGLDWCLQRQICFRVLDTTTVMVELRRLGGDTSFNISCILSVNDGYLEICKFCRTTPCSRWIFRPQISTRLFWNFGCWAIWGPVISRDFWDLVENSKTRACLFLRLFVCFIYLRHKFP